MTKIEEIPHYEKILEKNILYYVEIENGNLESAFVKDEVIESMKEYAEYYARKVLEIAAKEATASFECVGAVLGAENVYPFVEKDPILNIKLPKHV